MTAIEKRTQDILEAAVHEFIQTGEPVSSGWLYRNYDFGIKPAMIRLELNGLTDNGFLEQSHHSAGRVPSDRGYEFFAERILQEDIPSSMSDKHLIESFEEKNWREVVGLLASGLHILSAVNDSLDALTYKEGLQHLVGQLNWSSPGEVKEVVKDFEALDKRMENSRRFFKNRDTIQVFVGRKSPVTKSEHLAVVASNYDLGGDRVLLLAIGPKRMNYQKVAKTFQCLKQHGRRPKSKK